MRSARRLGVTAGGSSTPATRTPGPVYLEIPIDVLFARVDASRPLFPRTVRPDAAPAPASGAVARAIEMLRVAERPAILVGGARGFPGSRASSSTSPSGRGI